MLPAHVSIPANTLEDGAINAIEDLRANIEQFLKEACYQIKLSPSIYDDLEKEKQFLIWCIKNPSKIIQLPKRQHVLQYPEGIQISDQTSTKER